jgi:hypothetical protein
MHKPVKKGLGLTLHHKAGRPYPSVKQWATKQELTEFEQELNKHIADIRADIEAHIDDLRKKSNDQLTNNDQSSAATCQDTVQAEM